jgi:hypothetical protein
MDSSVFFKDAAFAVILLTLYMAGKKLGHPLDLSGT